MEGKAWKGDLNPIALTCYFKAEEVSGGEEAMGEAKRE